MNFKDWKIGTYKNYEDPTYYNEPSRHCKICDIEEEKTYFVDDTLICQDCYEEEEEEKKYIKKYIIPNETKENIKLFYSGCLQYDDNYLKEHKKFNKEYNKKLKK